VLVHREGLGEKISEEIGGAGDPGDDELLLGDPAAEPVEAHIDGLGFLWLNGVGGEAGGALVIAIDRGGGLRVAEGSEDSALVTSDLSIGKNARVLGLRYRGTDHGDPGTVAKYGTIDEGRVDCAEVVEAAGGASRFRAVEVRRVREDPKNHIGWRKNEAVGRVGFRVPKEAEGRFHGGLCGS